MNYYYKPAEGGHIILFLKYIGNHYDRLATKWNDVTISQRTQPPKWWLQQLDNRVVNPGNKWKDKNSIQGVMKQRPGQCRKRKIVHACWNRLRRGFYFCDSLVKRLHWHDHQTIYFTVDKQPRTINPHLKRREMEHRVYCNGYPNRYIEQVMLPCQGMHIFRSTTLTTDGTLK